MTESLRWAYKIKALADGRELQMLDKKNNEWVTVKSRAINPLTNPDLNWRVNEEGMVSYGYVYSDGSASFEWHNLDAALEERPRMVGSRVAKLVVSLETGIPVPTVEFIEL